MTNTSITRLHTHTKIIHLTLFNKEWANTLPNNIVKYAKLKGAAGLAHHPQLDIPVNNEHLLLQHWSATPEEGKVLTTNKHPISVMGVDA